MDTRTPEDVKPASLGPFEFGMLLERQHLIPTYQAIFDLATGEQIGAEALARWPRLGITPDVAFRLATRQARLADLDEACRRTAIDDAIAHGLPPNFALFVNLEPSVLGPNTAVDLVEQAANRVDLVVEITERALLHRPAELLRAVHTLRTAGYAIALDDVGANPDSLALLPFVAPDVIKLDLSLVQRWHDADQAAIYTAVAAYAERTGATILAEGIENDANLQKALALGATFGQGWHLSRPGSLGVLTSPSHSRLASHRPQIPAPKSPFSLLKPSVLRTAPKGLLLDISHHIENQALALETPPVVLGAFQHARYFTPQTARRYSRLAGRCHLVAALGVDLPAEPVPGVRGASLRADDTLGFEWVVVVIGTHYAGALIAQDMGDAGPDRDRRFAFSLTHDHETVLGAARSLLTRVIATGAYVEVDEILPDRAP
jgi:EAL domain-containing protein (putative c-di-GMP-specific phosphodiesterase class I)